MNSLVRWMFAVVCLVALAFSASAQGNGALPEAKNAFAHVAIINSHRTV